MDILHRLFSDVVKVDDNPAMFITTDVFKIDGKVKTIHRKEQIDLVKAEGDLISSIKQRIIENSKTESIKFYPKNIIQKIFNRKSLNKIINVPVDYYIITNDKLSSSFNCNLILDNSLEDMIIVGTKDIFILLEETNEYFFNTDNYKVYKIF
jgi:hypothetical protein